MPSTRLIAMLSLALAGGALGATSDARVEVQRVREAAGKARSEQSRLRGELNDVADRIGALKGRTRNALIPSELSELLQRSQELSARLTMSAAVLAFAEGELQKRSAALMDSLDQDAAGVRAAFDKERDRQKRRALLDQMRALRKEREQLRAGLPAQRAVSVPPSGSDDPADLLEEADALRDAQDKAAARMASIKARIAELEQELDLERRMDEFLGDSPFDERDRRFSTRNPQPAQDAFMAGPSAGAPAGPASGPPPTGGSPTPTAGAPEVSRSAQSTATPPRVGPSVPGSNLSGDDELGALRRQQREIEATSREVNARIGELERRAAELK